MKITIPAKALMKFYHRSSYSGGWMRPCDFIKEIDEFGKDMEMVTLDVPDSFVKFLSLVSKPCSVEQSYSLLLSATADHSLADRVIEAYNNSPKYVKKEFLERIKDTKLVDIVEEMEDYRKLVRERSRIYNNYIRKDIPYSFRTRNGVEITMKAGTVKREWGDHGSWTLTCGIKGGHVITVSLRKWRGSWFEVIREAKRGNINKDYVEVVEYDGKTHTQDYYSSKRNLAVLNLIGSIKENMDPRVRMVIAEDKPD